MFVDNVYMIIDGQPNPYDNVFAFMAGLPVALNDNNFSWGGVAA